MCEEIIDRAADALLEILEEWHDENYGEHVPVEVSEVEEAWADLMGIKKNDYYARQMKLEAALRDRYEARMKRKKGKG